MRPSTERRSPPRPRRTRPDNPRPRARRSSDAAQVEADEPPTLVAEFRYLTWSRDLAVGIFAVLPLWMLYEFLRLRLVPDERNGAEALIGDALMLLGPSADELLRIGFALLVLASATSLLRRQVPWARVAMVSAGEGVVYGMLLGPLTGALTFELIRAGALEIPMVVVDTEWVGARFGIDAPMAGDLIGSLGAGIFEEVVFRLGALTVLAFLLGRLFANFSIPPVFGVLGAILLSGLAFSWFHHIGPGGEPLLVEVFAFRAIAGILLGLLFVLRGFGVCVYTHAAYDVMFYLDHGS